jgi:membrane protein
LNVERSAATSSTSTEAPVEANVESEPTSSSAPGKDDTSWPHAVWAIVREAYEEWDRDNVSSLSAALSYYAAFATAPTLVLLVGALGTFLGKGTVRAEVLEKARLAMGPEGEAAVTLLLDHAPSKGSSVVATLVGAVVILVTTTGFFAELSRSLDTIFNVQEPRPSSIFALLRERAIAFTMVLLGGAFLVVTMISSAALAGLADVLPEWGATTHFFIRALSVVLGILTLAALFAGALRVLPRVKLSVRDVAIGSLLTALLFLLGTVLVGVYFAKSTLTSSFGAAGSFAAFLAWVYYSSQIFFFGAELTQVIAQRRKEKRLKSPLVEPPSLGRPSVGLR